ncbi:MAG: SMP-30/gluconolactonase/LRE family protein [Candidatus Marinimicrobia bacterium]|jgi:gluconolactonase|nr:SMP-30/gluconolactonase/LRE family protein [Candidatus Neomarinimicrobiota bacterium]
MSKIKFNRSVILLSIILLFFSCDKKIVNENEKWQVVATGLNFPEGPAWNKNGILYFSNCYGGWIGKINNDSLDTFLTASDSTFQKTNGLVISDNGDIFACEYGIGKLIKISPNGKNVIILSSGYNGKNFNHPNDLTFSTDENLFFSDPKSYGKEKLDGRIFYYDFRLKKVKLVADSLAYPNGIAISPLDKKLYVSESAKNRIINFDISESGFLENKKEFIKLPGGDPDGLEFDNKGNLFVAHFGTGTVFIISQKGKILQQIETLGKKPSNLEFGGNDLKTLYITEDETNTIYKLRINNNGCRK